jgi:2-polyprenyl-6-methoxyphenol hydroxylase-like FAD-dependent oxidoreductase
MTEKQMRAAIVGAGIGGLATALFLHRRGIECQIFEQVGVLRELGVGITLQTNAVKALVGLGLLPVLDAVAIRSEHLYYVTRRGQLVWDEPRGLAAGYDTPQFFIHRGHLQSLLYRAVLEQLPAGALHLGHQLTAIHQSETGIELSFIDKTGASIGAADADFVVGADGIHSTVRATVLPGEDDPRWSGLVLWRGATDWPQFLGGASLLIAGGVNTKFVVYPIGPGTQPETRLTNWAAQARVAPAGSSLSDRADWTRPARREDLAPILARFSVPQIDIHGLVGATDAFWEYPMCDRDPAPRWSVGRITLLGDAAHPMYPMGANGASQAILDAACLTNAIVSHNDVSAALAAYAAERLPTTAAIIRSNRTGGPEGVIDAVEERAPNGFEDVNAVLAHAEREAIVRGYAKQGGYGLETAR